MNDLELKPFYMASVSGGKDSLFMFYMLLNDWKTIYKLDGVVYFDLETDYPFIKDVINMIAYECKKRNLFFISFKPRQTWRELYNKYGYPTRRARWCNNMYKLDCQKQLEEYLKKFFLKPIMYIGFCADEDKRFKYDLFSKNAMQVYPIAEQSIKESYILEWAKNQPIYNDYYKYNKRCGCMMCPMSTMSELAYLYYYYPTEFDKFIDLAELNNLSSTNVFRYPKKELIRVIQAKYINMFKFNQMKLF